MCTFYGARGSPLNDRLQQYQYMVAGRDVMMHMDCNQKSKCISIGSDCSPINWHWQIIMVMIIIPVTIDEVHE